MQLVAQSPNAAPVMLTYRPVDATFEDQFGNKVKGVFCRCGVLWLRKDFAYYNNYGGSVRRAFLCHDCFARVSSVTDRVSRRRSDLPESRIPWMHWLSACKS